MASCRKHRTVAQVTYLEAALEYARHGWFVFPIDPVSKVPITPNGNKDATVSQLQILSWWTVNPTARIGIALRKSGLLAIDKDIGEGKQGAETLAALEALHGVLDRKINQQSNSGGEHILFKDPSPGPDGWTRTRDQGGSCRGKLGPGVDIKCNGYIVVEPSGNYRWLTDWKSEPPELTEAWVALIRKPIDEFGTGEGIDAWQTTVRPLGPVAKAALQARLDQAVRGEGEATTWIAISAIYHDFGLSVMDGREWLLAWNEKNKQPHTYRELTRQLTNIALKPHRNIRGYASDVDFAVPAMKALDTPPTRLEGLSLAWRIPGIIEESNKPLFTTPFENLNKRLYGGFTSRSVNLLVAGTGKGKSSMAGVFAYHYATTHGPVIYYVGEMTPEQVAARIIGQQLKASWVDVLRAKVSEAEMYTIAQGVPLYFIRRTPRAIEEIAAVYDVVVKEHPGKTPLLIVDYIQLLASGGKDMRMAMVEAVRDVQTFIETRDVCSLILSQSSRPNSKRIREGGGNAEDFNDVGAETSELERSASTVMVISYEAKDDVEIHEATMILAKGRMGGGARLGFKYNGKTGEWFGMAKPPASNALEETEMIIMSQLTVHTDHKCYDGRPCGKPLTKYALSKPKGEHKITGHKDTISAAIESLKKAGLITVANGSGILAFTNKAHVSGVEPAKE